MISNIDPTGEKFTDFERGEGKGPFKCGNCVHMDSKHGVCEHPIMAAASKQPRGYKDLPKVDDDDCCQYVRRPEK